jgi:hypothetical protein
MRRLYFCSEDGSQVIRSESFADDYLVPTSVGGKRSDTLQGATKATLTIPGATGVDGDVVYTSWHGGSGGDNFFVEHTVGETGEGFESRAHAVLFDPDNEDGMAIAVVFGTTSGGATIVPTAQQVADLVNGKAELAQVTTAAVGGTGNANVGELVPTYLQGGTDNGDWRKFNDIRGVCRRINTVEVI